MSAHPPVLMTNIHFHAFLINSSPGLFPMIMHKKQKMVSLFHTQISMNILNALAAVLRIQSVDYPYIPIYLLNPSVGRNVLGPEAEL